MNSVVFIFHIHKEYNPSVNQISFSLGKIEFFCFTCSCLPINLTRHLNFTIWATHV